MMKATILIATRNRANQLKLGLESIKAKNYQDVEMLVVNDGSTDNTASVLNQFKEMNLKIVEIARRGWYRKNPGYVLNAGHRVASSDVVIEQGGEVCHLTDCVTPLIENCRPGIVALARVYHGTPDDMALIKKDVDDGRYEFPMDIQPDKIKTSGEHWMVPRIGPHKTYLFCGLERPAPFLFLGAIHKQDFDAVGGYDERIPRKNDENLAIRLLAQGVKFRFLGKAVAFHLIHGKT